MVKQDGRSPSGPGSQATPEAASASSPSVSIPNASEVDWLEEGKKHFLATKLHPERLAANYPTQDTHTPKDEADYILGFKVARGEWERGEGLSGMEAYVQEQDENRDRDRRAEGSETAKTGSTRRARARAEGIAQPSLPTPQHHPGERP